MTRRYPFLLLLVSLFFVQVVEAELVVFTHGGFLKVKDFEVQGDHVQLTLRDGGALRMPMLKVARILADEAPEKQVAEVPSVPPSFQWSFDESQPQPETPFGDLIYEAARRHALNPALVAAVVRAESAFRPKVVSVKGAQGLMQLMPATAQRFGLAEGEAFEPAKNINAGTRYLRWLADRFDGQLAHMLAAYNAGEGTVDRYGGVPPYGETRRYLKRIYKDLGLSDEELARASVRSR